MTLPMLADFSLRLSCGLAFVLLLTSWRLVPPAFFRTHCLVMLGLLVVAALDATRVGAPRTMLTLTISAAVLAYLATVCWGLGIYRLGRPALAALTSATAFVLVADARVSNPWMWALNGSGMLASAVLLGSSLSAMLLGHHYLTAPTMSIEPLMRYIRFSGVSLSARAALAVVGAGLWATTPGPSAGAVPVSPLLLLVIRWGMGVLGPAVALWLSWKTAEIRSTQSATGILYIAVTLVLFGELSAMVLTREAGVLF